MVKLPTTTVINAINLPLAIHPNITILILFIMDPLNNLRHSSRRILTQIQLLHLRWQARWLHLLCRASSHTRVRSWSLPKHHAARLQVRWLEHAACISHLNLFQVDVHVLQQVS